jgi:signal transduction histidine kinase
MGRYAELTDLDLRLQRAQLPAPFSRAPQTARESGGPAGDARAGVKMLEGYVDELLRILDAYAGTAASLATDRQARMELERIRSELARTLLCPDLPALLEYSRVGMRRIGRMVESLKDAFLAEGADEWRWSDLHRHLDDVVRTIRDETGTRAEVRKEYGDIPRIECLPLQLSRAFMHLTANAADAVAGAHHGRIVVRTGSENDRIWVEISDNGGGIAPENRKRIFHPFFTTKPAGAGIGLGLPMAADIVRRHGGCIHVTSKAGEGSSFRVHLPRRRSAG